MRTFQFDGDFSTSIEFVKFDVKITTVAPIIIDAKLYMGTGSIYFLRLGKNKRK